MEEKMGGPQFLLVEHGGVLKGQKEGWGGLLS